MAAKRRQGNGQGQVSGAGGYRCCSRSFSLLNEIFYFVFKYAAKEVFPLRQQQVLLIYVPFGESRLSLCA